MYVPVMHWLSSLLLLQCGLLKLLLFGPRRSLSRFWSYGEAFTRLRMTFRLLWTLLVLPSVLRRSFSRQRFVPHSYCRKSAFFFILFFVLADFALLGYVGSWSIHYVGRLHQVPVV
jgi:hypothetical protein